MSVRVSWDQVFAWRMQRQFLSADGGRVIGHGDEVDAVDVADVVRRLAGVQAQVASSARAAVAVRRTADSLATTADVDAALGDGRLVKTWAMRGTLHLLPADVAGSYLALMAAGRSWTKPSWQKAFGVSPAQIERLAEIVTEALDGQVLTRDQLVEQVTRRTRNADLANGLRSGWGTVLKPLAWKGVLCHGPSTGTRVTFTSPDTYLSGWTGLPEPAEAAPAVIRAYLGAHGPASITTFGKWLFRGASTTLLRHWFDVVGDIVTTVDVEGEHLLALADNVEAIAATKPTTSVRLLPAFDQYVLGPQTDDPHLIPPGRRADVSRTAGWIAPVVVWRGRVAGTWEFVDGGIAVAPFDEVGRIPARPLATERRRVTRLLGTPATARSARRNVTTSPTAARLEPATKRTKERR